MWETVLSSAFLVGLLGATIRMAASILMASIGEVFSERAGVLNIGLEGIILVGAFTGFVGAYYAQNPWVGVGAGVLAGVLTGLGYAFAVVTLGMNQMVGGIAINIVSLGLTSFLYRLLFGVSFLPPSAPSLPVTPIPVLSAIPVLGPILFNHALLVYIALLMVPITAYVLFRSGLGLTIRAVGEHPRAAESVGINVQAVRYACVILNGALAGLAGTYISLGQLNMFMDNISAGRGFMALATVIFGKWNPYLVLAGTLLFGFADALQLRLQSIGVHIPYQFLVMAPYVLTIVALVAVVGRGEAPAALGCPYPETE